MPSIPARELREHFSPRPRPDYLKLVVDHTRSVAARLATETHWGPYDAPMRRGQQQAACGSYVNVERFSADPTCAACRQEQAIFEAMEF
jgi:hypothetical protein